MNLFTVDSGSIKLENAPSIIIPIEGEGVVKGADEARKISMGDYFFLPCSARGAEIKTSGRIAFVECLPKQFSL